MDPREIAEYLLQDGGDWGRGKIVMKVHESDIYCQLAVRFVEGNCWLQGKEVDIHISMLKIPAGVPADHIKAAMEERWWRKNERVESGQEP